MEEEEVHVERDRNRRSRFPAMLPPPLAGTIQLVVNTIDAE
jgi:hypothetical protein